VYNQDIAEILLALGIHPFSIGEHRSEKVYDKNFKGKKGERRKGKKSGFRNKTFDLVDLRYFVSTHLKPLIPIND
jgi:hypothetical protein